MLGRAGPLHSQRGIKSGCLRAFTHHRTVKTPPRCPTTRARWRITANTSDAVIAFHAGVWWLLHDHFNQRYDYACAVLVRPNRTSPTGDISGLLDPSPDMALAAMDLLDQAIRHQEHGIQTSPRKQLVPLHWHQGSTLRHK